MKDQNKLPRPLSPSHPTCILPRPLSPSHLHITKTLLINKINFCRFSKKTLLLLYFSAVLLSSIRGGLIGFRKWHNWLDTRKPVSLNIHDNIFFDNDLVEPIVNTAVDGAKLVFDVSFSFISSCVITAFFPISVPLIIKYSS